ncbi:hypothetical protein J4402_04780 [Candidatus Pacearchaeota archaeon]|nr:hypothetical protein [Candidatus Pacearchaeota archaeon]
MKKRVVEQETQKKDYSLYNQYNSSEFSHFKPEHIYKIVNWHWESLFWKLMFTIVSGLNFFLIIRFLMTEISLLMVSMLIIVTFCLFFPAYFYIFYKTEYYITKNGIVRVCKAFSFLPHFKFGRLWKDARDVKYTVRNGVLYLYFPYLSNYKSPMSDRAFLYFAWLGGARKNIKENDIMRTLFKIKAKKEQRKFIINKLQSKNHLKFKEFKRYL